MYNLINEETSRSELRDQPVYPVRVATRMSGFGFYRIATICLATLSVILLISIIAVAARSQNKSQESSAGILEKQKQDLNISFLMATISKLHEEKKELQLERDELLVKPAAKTRTDAPVVVKPTVGVTQTSEVCPTNWHSFESSCYLISTNRLSWPRSKAYCQSQQGHLAIILTAEEQTFIWNLLPRAHWNAFWFGITDGETEDVWKWVDDTPLVGGFWAAGEPNNHINEDCGYIVKTEVLERVATSSWIDAPCFMVLPFICEKKMNAPAQ